MTISLDKLFEFLGGLADRLGAKAFITFGVTGGVAVILYFIIELAENIQELVAAQWIIISGFGAMTVVAAIFMFARHKEKMNGNSKPLSGGES